jgi:hypothetical protein
MILASRTRASIGFRPTGAPHRAVDGDLDPRVRAGQVVVSMPLRNTQTWPDQPPQILRPGAFILSADSALLNLSLRLVGAVIRLREPDGRP